MKVFSASQIRACDEATIRAGAMRSADLMERAASRCTEWITSRHSRDVLFVVVCGAGNNGGDGLAIARMLHQRNYGVKAFLLQYTDTMSEDCALNLDRLKVHDPALVTVIEPGTFISGLPAHIVIIDAIFGTGLSRPTSGWVADFIDSINQMPNKKIAIDMPSGLAPDYVPDEEKGVLKANETLTFQFYKRCFFHPESAPFTGGINLINIDLDRNFIAQASTQYYLTEKADIKAYYKPRKGFAHKGDFGKVLLIGGSYGKTGAIALSAMGALRAGAGTATTLAPECGYATLQANVPEAMCLTAGETHLTTLDAGNFTAIGIGPGMGTHVDTTKAFGDLLDNARAPIVADADALNMLAKHPEWLHKLPKGSIITPHPREFERLFGTNTSSMVQVDNARIQAMRYNINIVLKGRYTAVISNEGDCWYNITGNPGMATGGSGDVLTGVITSLLAQGYTPFQAAQMGVYLHGRAGDLAAADLSQEALIASDLVNYLGKVFLELAS